MSLRKILAAITAGSIVIAGVSYSAFVAAEQADNAEAIMHQRHENFEEIGESFKTIRDQLRSDKPDMAVVSGAAETINQLAQELHTWFPAGTGPETGIDTEAKPEIWQNKGEFNAAAKRLVDESGKFLTLTRSGDARQVAGGIRGLGGACKNCHDQFRVDED